MQDTSRGILVTSLVYLQKQERETEISRQLIPHSLVHLWSLPSHIQNCIKFRISIVAQRKWIRLGTMKLQVRSLTLLSGLRTWHCYELWCNLQT